MANQQFTQFFNTKHKYPVLLDVSFVVDSTNGNGLGIRSLKGPGIANVYMHTSATPAAGNPNPLSGYIYVQVQDQYPKYLGGFSGFVSQLSGSNINISGSSVLTVGKPYVITSVGTSTAANWQAVGLPVGVVPAVGASFFASVTGGGTGTGVVQAASVTGITSIEVVGDPNQTLNQPVATGAQYQLSPFGGYMILQCLADTNSSTTTKIPTAPPDGAVVGLAIYLNNTVPTNLAG